MTATSTEIVAPPYHVQSTAEILRDGFPYFTHHDSVSALWSQKWHPLSAAGIYPFTEAWVGDFDPVFAKLRIFSGDDPDFLIREPDEYARAFLPVGEELVSAAQKSAAEGSVVEARDLYLRAAAVYRIARFPIIRSPLTREAWETGKAAYELAGRLLSPPSAPVTMPFIHSDADAGDSPAAIPAYLRIPEGTRPVGGWPVVLVICGLDAYRTDHTQRTQAHVDRGFAALSFEIPGTGDCPAAPNDPASADRLMGSILDWVADSAPEYGFNPGKIFARGISTGAYYAMRVAHTHAGRLTGAVAQGLGCHHMFDAGWIHAQDQMEYPFGLANALAYKFGYRHTDTATAVENYAADASKFSLATSGLLRAPACKLLVINGMEDSIYPSEDSILAATQGTGKDLVARGNRRHMGNPGAGEIIYEWFGKALAGRP